MESVLLWENKGEKKLLLSVFTDKKPDEVAEEYPYPKYTAQAWHGDLPEELQTGRTYDIGYDPFDWE